MENVKKFAQQYGPLASAVGERLGVSPDVLLGQWGLETGWGSSVIPGTNNLGNIKDFSGRGVKATDNMTGSRDAYRAYDTPQQFGDDFVNLMARRYSNAIGAGADAKKFATALKSRGYAEDPDYVSKIAGTTNLVRKVADGLLTAVSGTAHAKGTNMPKIDPAQVKWDDAPSEPTIDVAKVKWDDAPSEKKPGALQNIGVGAIRGLANIGATVLEPIDAAARALGIQNDWIGRTDRREKLDEFARENADTDSLAYQGGKLGAEVGATLPVGGLLGKAVTTAAAPLVSGTRAAPVVNALSNALTSGGFRIGQGVSNPLARAALRGAGGAGAGGAAAGLVDPEAAGVGALIGGALPAGAKAAGAIGRGLRKAVIGEGASQEVVDLARRAADLGVDIPADRVVNSKPLNAVASGLNYVPFSGRAATEARMESQLNRALSRTFGQDSDNVTMALRKASTDLGQEFDRVLRNNAVTIDDAFLTKLADISEAADKELGQDGLRVISKQIDELLSKGASGQIDGQAAYNIKRTLDRIGKRNTPEAYQARQLKGALMEALDRSLGPDAAAAFAKTRKQYGNMLALENLAQNGAEGGVSVARLANMKNINNPDLQELADIAAQFVRQREGQHGAMQRGVAALGLGGTLGLPGLVGIAAAGRAGNTLLNASPVRNALMQPVTAQNPFLESAAPNLLLESLRRSAPLIPGQAGIQAGQR